MIEMGSNRSKKIFSLLKHKSSLDESLSNISSVSQINDTTLDSNPDISDSTVNTSYSGNPGYIEVNTDCLKNNLETQVTLSTVRKALSKNVRNQLENCEDHNEVNSPEDDSVQDPDYEVNSPSSDNSEKKLGENEELKYDHIQSEVDSSDSENSKKESRKNNKKFETILTREKTKKSKMDRILKQVTSPNKNQNLITGLVDVDHKSLHIMSSKENTKRHFCFFCKKLQTKLARHLETQHAKEKEVKLFKSFPKKSTERLNIITELRKKGDFLYNSYSKYNGGDIILVRRPEIKKKRTAKHYLPCGQCGAMYSILSLNLHFKHCLETKDKLKKDVLCASRQIGFVNLKANFIMRNKILPHMRNDEINELIRNESLILLFGNRLTQKYRSPHLFKMIRSRLRCVGKFYHIFKKIKLQTTSLESVFDPSQYDNVVKAVNELAGLNEETGKYRAPATASSICTILKKISLYLISESIKKKDKEKIEEVRNFLQLLEEGFTYDIYKTVVENQLELKRNKVIKLPLTKDIARLKTYLDNQIKIHYNKLLKKFSLNDWKELSSAVLISLQLFNRRRAGEIERIKIKDFLQNETVDAADEMIEDVKLDNGTNYVRFLIRGKLGRGVPVLVDKFKVKCIKLILDYRKNAQVSDTNPYVFGIKGTDNMKHLEANRLMSYYANICGAEHPERLRGTELRKQFATKCGVMDLQGINLKDVADYMGHHEKIHLEHYRLPNATRDILRMSTLLEKAQGTENIFPLVPSITKNEVITPYKSKENFKDDLNQEDDFNTPPDSFNTPSDSFNTPPDSFNTLPDSFNTSSVRNIRKRVSWSLEEKHVVEKKAKFYLSNFESPTLDYCSSLVKKYAVLKRRSPVTLKAYIMNEIKRRKQNVTCTASKKGIKKFWTAEEKNKIFDVFHEYLANKKLPSLKNCKKAINNHDILKDRTPETLKAFINNTIRKGLLQCL